MSRYTESLDSARGGSSRARTRLDNACPLAPCYLRDIWIAISLFSQDRPLILVDWRKKTVPTTWTLSDGKKEVFERIQEWQIDSTNVVRITSLRSVVEIDCFRKQATFEGVTHTMRKQLKKAKHNGYWTGWLWPTARQFDALRCFG